MKKAHHSRWVFCLHRFDPKSNLAQETRDKHPVQEAGEGHNHFTSFSATMEAIWKASQHQESEH